MNCRYFLLLSLGLLVVDCKSDKSTNQDIESLEAKLAKEPDQETLRSLLNLYQQKAENTSGDERMNFLWKTGETARAVKEFDIAEKAFTQIYNEEPTSELAGKALFIHAFMCDEDLKQFDRAKVLYEQFLENFPQSDFHDDAQFLLKHLGKSDEEMLELLSQGQEQ